MVNDFPPIYNAKCRVLILGSMPSEASRAANFYYMNPRNRFWSVMSEILGEDYVSMTSNEKATALLSHGIALYDVVHTCAIKGSDDASITEVQPTDIPAILRSAPIQKILLNGQKAAGIFGLYFQEETPRAETLPSTSPANAKCSLSDLVKVWREALRAILI